MAPGRSSSVFTDRPALSESSSELDYCERVSAYLGLTLETVMSMAKTDASGSAARRNRKRGVFPTVRPRRREAAGALPG